MKAGDVAKRYIINQRTGLRALGAPVLLLRRVGTVPDFWEFQILGGVQKGMVLRDFVYEEDQEQIQKPQLTVLKGGQDGSEG